MADITDMLVQSGLQSSQQAPDITGAIDKGAQLGMHIEQMKAQREQLEMAKQQQQLAKVDKLTSAMIDGAKIKSKAARNAFFKEYIPKMQSALGLQDFIPADTMAMIQADPEEAKKFSLLKDKIMNNEMTYAQAVAQMETEAWATMDDSEVSQLENAEKFRLQQEAGLTKASMMAGPRAGQLETRKVDQAAQAKNKIDTDTVLKGTVEQLQNVKKAQDLIGKGTPSWTAINEAMQDLSSAMNPKSGGSDHKLKEIEIQNFDKFLGQWSAKATSNPDQPANAESIAFVKHFAERLNSSYRTQGAARAKQLGSEARKIYGKSNPAAADAVENTVNAYVDGSAFGYEPTFEVRSRRLTLEQLKALPDGAKKLLPPDAKKALGIK